MWDPDAIRFEPVVDGPALDRLVELLTEVFTEFAIPSWQLRAAKPLVIARDFGVADRYGSEQPGEVYRFQLGPRAWSAKVYWDEQSPTTRPVDETYERAAIAAARGLQSRNWTEIARSLLPGDNTDARAEAVPDTRTQVSLCWQEDGNFLTIHDLVARHAVSYRWVDGGLALAGAPHREPLLELGREDARFTRNRPIISVREGMHVARPGERAGRMAELRSLIAWRYETRLDGTLDNLLLEAFDRLRVIPGEIGIAYAGYRFNDASGDPSWLAARLDNFAWENGAYFQRNATSLRSAPPALHELLGLLVHLQESGAHTEFKRAYGYPVEPLDVIGLFRQADVQYFACCNSQGGGGPVYLFDTAVGRTKLCGFTDRFDWNFNIASRVGGIIPRDPTLEVVSVDEVMRRVETGETPYDSGPPHDMSVPWEVYAPPSDDD